jgi:hypothetical protein
VREDDYEIWQVLSLSKRVIKNEKSGVIFGTLHLAQKGQPQGIAPTL